MFLAANSVINNQAVKKQMPPMGVIMPNQLRLRRTSKYKLPENSNMPENINHPAQCNNLESGAC